MTGCGNFVPSYPQYLNTGTWADLIALPRDILCDDTVAAKIALTEEAVEQATSVDRLHEPHR
jgi:hypothetical protein